MIWQTASKKIALTRPFLMGILNLTPDSFSDGGCFTDPQKAVDHALEMVQKGADILDLGGESTRPGAQSVAAAEELARLLPVLKALRPKTKASISIDTTKPEVARACLGEGADIINDISGLADSGPDMAKAVRESGAGVILMHRRGNPATMQTLTHYEDVVQNVLDELSLRIEEARRDGISDDQIVIDPGLGFAKTSEQNLDILGQIDRFHSFGLPVLVGPSRKTFLGKTTGREVGDRDFATAAVVAYCMSKGIQIFRVHEVAAIRDVVKVMQAIMQTTEDQRPRTKDQKV